MSGHYLDTGEGPIQLDASEPQAKDAAWAAHREHRRGCSQCQRTLWRCAEGNRLWNAYIEVSSS